MPADATLLTVVGARPQFIKSAALTRALAGSGWTEHLVHAGQHPDDHMGTDFLMELGVPAPAVRLTPSQAGRTERMADMMQGIGAEIEKIGPEVVVVYGDTDATLAGALAAHHAGVPLIHVEAGLRSGDRNMPEELNRILTDQLANMWVTTGPGPTAQLIAEGAPAVGIVEAGDVMLDVALAVKAGMAQRRPPMWPTSGPVLAVTLHRPALVDVPSLLSAALQALGQWASATGGQVYFPVHPRTAARMEEMGMELPVSVINPGPLGYVDMQSALCHADAVLTDSGGLQKEAWYQGTGAVVLRDTTEWTELLDLGASVLFDPKRLLEAQGAEALAMALQQPFAAASVEDSRHFGGGQAAARIVGALDRWNRKT